VLLRRYVHGDGVDDPIVWYDSSGTTNKRNLFKDERGSVIAADAGTAVTSIKYDEYGNATTAGANSPRFKYTGQTWLPELGLDYYKARIYNPDLGRFMQTDPIGTQDQINLYAYVGNDPMNGADPSGATTCRDMTEADCAIARDTAAQASEDLKALAAQLRSVIDERKAGGENLTAADEQLLQSVDELYGSVSDAKLRGIANLADGASKALSYNSSTVLVGAHANYLDQQFIGRFNAFSPGQIDFDMKAMRFYRAPDGFSSIPRPLINQQRTMAHEGGHYAGGFFGFFGPSEQEVDQMACLVYYSACLTEDPYNTLGR
jgi:RHS repeat-associated protein